MPPLLSSSFCRPGEGGQVVVEPSESSVAVAAAYEFLLPLLLSYYTSCAQILWCLNLRN